MPQKATFVSAALIKWDLHGQMSYDEDALTCGMRMECDSDLMEECEEFASLNHPGNAPERNSRFGIFI